MVRQVIDRLSADLSRSFPGSTGFSVRNFWYMRASAAAWEDDAIVQQLAAQLPWHHPSVVLDKVPSHWRTPPDPMRMQQSRAKRDKT
jgi:hypothetical protein